MKNTSPAVADAQTIRIRPVTAPAGTTIVPSRTSYTPRVEVGVLIASPVDSAASDTSKNWHSTPRLRRPPTVCLTRAHLSSVSPTVTGTFASAVVWEDRPHVPVVVTVVRDALFPEFEFHAGVKLPTPAWV